MSQEVPDLGEEKESIWYERSFWHQTLSREKRAEVLELVPEEGKFDKEITEDLQEELGRRRYRKNPLHRVHKTLKDLQGFGLVDHETAADEEEEMVYIPGPPIRHKYSITEKGQEILGFYEAVEEGLEESVRTR